MEYTRDHLTTIVILYILLNVPGKINWCSYYSPLLDIEKLHKQSNFKHFIKQLRTKLHTSTTPLTQHEIRVAEKLLSIPLWTKSSIDFILHHLKLSFLKRSNTTKLQWSDLVQKHPELQHIYKTNYNAFRNKVRSLVETKIDVILECSVCHVKFTQACLLQYGLKCICGHFLSMELLDLGKTPFTFIAIDTKIPSVFGKKSLLNTIHHIQIIHSLDSLDSLDSLIDSYKEFDILIDLSNKFQSILGPSSTHIVPTRVFETFLYNIGILFSVPIDFIDSQKCFKITQSFCKCNIPCVLRNISNTFYPNRDRWYPLNTFDIDPYIFPIISQIIHKTPEIYIDTIDPTEILKKIMNKSKTIQLSTRKTYENTMLSLYKQSLLLVILTPEIFISELMQLYKLSTVVKYLSIIQVFFQNLNNYEIKLLFTTQNYTRVRIIQQIYKDFLLQLQNTHTFGIKSTRQIENWTEWNELEKLVLVLSEKYKQSGNEQDLQNYISFKLQVHQNTLRNDYSSLMYRYYNKESDNYIDLDSNVIVWNKFKTSKHHGSITYDISDLLKDDLLHLVDYRTKQDKFDFLFVHNDKCMTNKQYGAMLCKITSTYLHKNIGSQLMRTIKVSDFRKDEISVEKDEEFSRNMQHTSTTSRKHYRKI